MHPAPLEPFVRPVRLPRSVAFCTAEPPLAQAGETGTWTFPMQLAEPLPGGSEVLVLFHGGRNVKGVFAPLQVTTPQAPGFVELIGPDGTPLAPQADQSAQGVMAFGVPPEGLDAGAELRVVAHSVRAPQDSLSNKMVYLYVPAEAKALGVPSGNAEEPRRIVAACLIHVTGAETARLRLYAPGTVPAGRPFDVLVRPEDRRGNVASDRPQQLELSLDGETIRAQSEPVQDCSCVRFTGIHLPAGGVHRLAVRDTAAGLQALSNPVEILSDAAPRLLWGYIHGHTELSDGAGTVDSYFTYMRDTLALDFGALGDHDHLFEITPEMWRMAQEATARYHQPDRFVTLLGYEWAKWRRNGDGDRNVYYLQDHRPMYRSDEGHYPNPPALFSALAAETAIVIPHHPAEIGNHCDYKDHDPQKERLVEIYSNWGNSERSVHEGNPYPVRPSQLKPGDGPDAGEVPEGFVQRALALGWRVGFTGGGDDHSGHPGDERGKGTEPFQYGAGLLGVWADRLDREALWEALLERHCYATTGARISLRFALNTAPMGSELSLTDHPALASRRELQITVHGTAPIRRIEVVRGNRDILVYEGSEMDVELRWRDEEPFETIALPPAPYWDTPFCFYYVRVTQVDGHMAWASPVWVS